MKKVLVHLLVLATAVALTACSSDSGHEHAAASEIPLSEDFNDADVDYATGMIQHHAQALSMVDLTVGRKLSPELTKLTEQVRAVQGPEIETMVDWLNEWDQPVPETMRDHVNAHGGGEVETDPQMPGMMSSEQLDELGSARGAAFEQLWLEMMIEHHRGAIEMAEAERSAGEMPEVIDLAEAVIAAQQEEIEQMEALLG